MNCNGGEDDDILPEYQRMKMMSMMMIYCKEKDDKEDDRIS